MIVEIFYTLIEQLFNDFLTIVSRFQTIVERLLNDC